MEPALASMLKTQWGSLANVSGESPYIADLVKSIDLVVGNVRGRVEQKKYLRNFYDKAARCGHGGIPGQPYPKFVTTSKILWPSSVL